MFDKDYAFRGTHAIKVKKLTNEFDSNKNKLFERNFDVYMLAPIVGLLYNIKADVDVSNTDEAKIAAGLIMKEKEHLMFNYRIILLLDEKYEPDFEKRIDKAFRHYADDNKNQEDYKLYESYVRGGVDVIYEKLMVEIKNTDDYLENLYNFLEEVNLKFNMISRDMNDEDLEKFMLENGRV